MGVECFPVKNLIAMSGSDDDEKYEIATCQDPDDAHRRQQLSSNVESIADDKRKQKYLKRKFFQLVLLSEQLRNLYTGGAKFNPIEVGFALCWIPIPGEYSIASSLQRHYSTETPVSSQQVENSKADNYNRTGHVDGTSNSLTKKNSNKLRAENSGRYGLMDSAAEMIGLCATKRLIALTREECLEILQTSQLNVNKEKATIEVNGDDRKWWQRWGKHRLSDTEKWSTGGVIVVCPFNGVENRSSSTIFLSCVLRDVKKTASKSKIESYQTTRRLDLLTEEHLVAVWRRLLSNF